MRTIRFTNRFKKDLKRIKKRGQNTHLIKTVIANLANDIPLDRKYRDHALIGNYAGTRECHLALDWLLIYQYGANDELILIRTGSHSDLFE